MEIYMIRNKHLLKFLRFRIKTLIHVGAGNGEDRDTYSYLGAQNLYWIEASTNLANNLNYKYPSDTVLNMFMTNESRLGEDASKSNKMGDSNDKYLRPTETLRRSDVARSTLDLYFDLIEMKKAVMLVIDTDGSDLEVLEGAYETLKSVEYLVVEQHYFWDDGNWYTAIAKFCTANGFKKTLTRPSYNNDYEDVLYTRKSVLTIFFINISDKVFLALKQIKHFIIKLHFSTTYFHCEKCVQA
jgi:FkbM family methyltransferase